MRRARGWAAIGPHATSAQKGARSVGGASLQGDVNHLSAGHGKMMKRSFTWDDLLMETTQKDTTFTTWEEIPME